MSNHPNSILQNLPRSDLALFEGALKAHTFGQGEVLAEVGAPIDRVFFPNSGLISIIVPLSTGEVIEAGVIGRADVFGASAAFGIKNHVNSAVVQMPASASVVRAVDLAAAANQSETLRRTLFVNDQFILAQAQQSAACNARHNITQRLATWLLRVQDRSQQKDLNLTQEFLSQMIGVQRASVSLAASAMQDAGMIQYRRGILQITNRDMLEDTACECYSALRTQRERMFSLPHAPSTAIGPQPVLTT